MLHELKTTDGRRSIICAAGTPTMRMHTRDATEFLGGIRKNAVLPANQKVRNITHARTYMYRVGQRSANQQVFFIKFIRATREHIIHNAIKKVFSRVFVMGIIFKSAGRSTAPPCIYVNIVYECLDALYRQTRQNISVAVSACKSRESDRIESKYWRKNAFRPRNVYRRVIYTRSPDEGTTDLYLHRRTRIRSHTCVCVCT